MPPRAPTLPTLPTGRPRPGPTRRAVLAAGGLALARPALAGPLTPHRAEDFTQSVGVNTHFGQPATPYVGRFDRCAAALDELGIRHLRDDIVLQGPEPPPQFQRIGRLARDGYRFTLMFYDGLDVAPLVPPRRLPDIAAWSAGGLEIAEGGNEPKIATGAGRAHASAEHQRALYRAARNDLRGPSVRVAGPSYVQADVAAAENLANAVDFGNIHPYPGMEHPENAGDGDLRRFIAAAKPVFGNAPLLATENGYHTALATQSFHLPVSEGIRARYLPRLLLWSFLQGVRRTYIYELIASFDRGDSDPESRFGLLRFDGSPTPAFAAVANLMRLFRGGAGHAAPLDVTIETWMPDLRAARFLRGDGAVLVPVWLGVDGWDRVRRIARPDLPARPVAVTLSAAPKAVRLHRFADDGSVSLETVAPLQRLSVGVTDRLAVLEVL